MKILYSFLAVLLILTGCDTNAKQEAEALRIKQVTIDSLSIVIAQQYIIDSMQAETASRNLQNRQIVKDRSTSKNEVVAAKPKKKGWSNIAKGAVIGAGSGAVSGALIDKKHGEGVIVGGLLGAGVGVATGAIIDGNIKKTRKQ